METSLGIRLLMIFVSIPSLIFQTIGIVGHGWFGFSLFMDINGTAKVNEYIDGGLFYISPMQVCVDAGNGSVCKSPEEFPPDARKMFGLMTTALAENFAMLKALVILAAIASCCGMVLLYLYICVCKKTQMERGIGIASAVSWVLAALLEFIAVGIQVARNKDTANGFKLMKVALEQQNILIQADLITPWAAILTGIGASLALVTGLTVTMTTCGKRFNKTIIIYRELMNGEGKVDLMLDNDDDD